MYSNLYSNNVLLRPFKCMSALCHYRSRYVDAYEYRFITPVARVANEYKVK